MAVHGPIFKMLPGVFGRKPFSCSISKSWSCCTSQQPTPALLKPCSVDPKAKVSHEKMNTSVHVGAVVVGFVWLGRFHITQVVAGCVNGSAPSSPGGGLQVFPPVCPSQVDSFRHCVSTTQFCSPVTESDHRWALRSDQTCQMVQSCEKAAYNEC